MLSSIYSSLALKHNPASTKTFTEFSGTDFIFEKASRDISQYLLLKNFYLFLTNPMTCGLKVLHKIFSEKTHIYSSVCQSIKNKGYILGKDYFFVKSLFFSFPMEMFSLTETATLEGKG